MLSLDNAFAEQDLLDFAARIRRFLKLGDDDRINFSAEPRSMACRCRCATRAANSSRPPRRGDGAVGEESRQHPNAEDVPQKLRGRNVPDICEVRGEVYMTKQAFLALQRAAEGSRRHDLLPIAQFGGRLAAPIRIPASPPPRPLGSSPMPGADGRDGGRYTISA